MAGSATVGALRVTLGLDSAAFSNGLSQAQKNLQGVGKSMQAVGARMASVGAGISAALTGPILAMSAVAVSEAVEMRDAMAQVSDALAGVGKAAGKSLGQLQAAADGLSASSLYEDDAILRDVTTTLLRFGTVSGSVFDRAQAAVVNYAAGAKKDLGEAATAIGRALSDPEKAAGRLARAGVLLTDQQENQIKVMSRAGDAAGAQAVILSALESRYPAAAKAARDAASPFERLNLTFKNIAGQIGTTLLPFMDKLAATFEGLGAKFAGLSPEMQKFVTYGLGIAAALGPAIVVIGGIVGAIGLLAASPLLPFIAGAGIAAAALGVIFAKWGKEIVPVLQDFGKQVADVLGPKIQPLMKAAGAAAKALGDLFVSIFSDKGGDGKGSAASALENFGMVVSRIMGAFADILTGAFRIATDVVRAFTAFLHGDFTGMWSAIGSVVKDFGMIFVRVFQTLFPEAIQWVKKTVDGVREWFGARLGAIFDGVASRVKTVGDAFFNLYDRVVGHSYVPDMVDGIAEWMAKLQGGMVVPALNATDAARSAFETLREDVAAIMEGLLTDTERAALALSKVKATLADGVKKGVIGSHDAKVAEGGAAWAGATVGDPVVLNPLGTEGVDIAKGMRERAAEIQQTLDDAAMHFGDVFSDTMSRAFSGDIGGAFRDMLGDALRHNLATLGAGLFKGAAGGSFGSVFKSIASAFAGTGGLSLGTSGGIKFGGALPGFKDGGTFALGGAGGIA